jgi:hypothetical protein
MALENAVEGCVNETYGALVTMHQAEAAADDDIRCEMRSIARDEVRHAQLAWDVMAWCMSRLDPTEQTKVRAAVRDAAQKLTPARLPNQVREPLGLPCAHQSRKMLDGLRQTLWSA